jgi:hypothetical protein
MSEHALMKKGEATMNVPPDKVDAYKADGWIVIDRPPELPAPAQAEDVEPGAQTPADLLVPDASKNSIDEVVERIHTRRRSKKAKPYL